MRLENSWNSLDELEPGSDGWLPALGDSWLYWEYDGETITVWYWEDGKWVIAPFEPDTKPDPPIQEEDGE